MVGKCRVFNARQSTLRISKVMKLDWAR